MQEKETKVFCAGFAFLSEIFGTLHQKVSRIIYFQFPHFPVLPCGHQPTPCSLSIFLLGIVSAKQAAFIASAGLPLA
jgi:hypothetical protein